ncbi:uncharacterized protein BKCO1_2500050 [Diplodia corticola]|uniref:Uncharacterized protein n=1 Tax=Diplodia corticola TaxID=236234 RepID=A0A1J9R1N3_9PEZI|nr:uncharacterized protein BKCO1_2500050 [Diplodia corticola]OJD34154.1 hypothetical protein BKCO1_2500050 [Diplodia corticola]
MSPQRPGPSGVSDPAETHQLAFRTAAPAFHTATASGNSPRRPLLFVHVDAASEQEKTKPRARSIKREIRSHVQFHVNEKKRRSGIQQWTRNLRQSAAVATSLGRQTIRGIGSGRLDPFETRPVKETPFYRSMMDFYFHDMPAQAPYAYDDVAVTSPKWAESLWRVSGFEPVSFFAIIHFVAILYGKLRGVDMTTEVVIWEQRAHSMVTEFLASGRPISDPIACAVGALALCASNEGSWEIADMHYTGLFALTHARGGLEAFAPVIQSGLIWCENDYAMRHMTVPAFHQELSPRSVQQWLEAFPPELRRQASLRHQSGQRRLPTVGADLDSILLSLHHLSIAQEPSWNARMNRPAMRKTFYDSEHKLLVILADSKTRQERSPTLSAAERVRSAVAQTAQLFLLAALREMPLQTAVNNLLVERLHTTVSAPGFIDQWIRTAHLHGLLWVLFVGWAVSTKDSRIVSPRQWFEEHLTQLMWQLDLRYEDLEEVLAQFPSTDAFCREPRRQLQSRSSVVDETCLVSSESWW